MKNSFLNVIVLAVIAVVSTILMATVIIYFNIGNGFGISQSNSSSLANAAHNTAGL